MNAVVRMTVITSILLIGWALVLLPVARGDNFAPLQSLLVTPVLILLIAALAHLVDARLLNRRSPQTSGPTGTTHHRHHGRCRVVAHPPSNADDRAMDKAA